MKFHLNSSCTINFLQVRLLGITLVSLVPISSVHAACAPCHPSNTTLSSSVGSKVYRQQNFTLTATVSSANNADVSGEILFKDKGILLEKKPLINRSASLSKTYQNTGDHVFIAEYLGNNQMTGSVIDLPVSVVPKETTRINLIPNPASVSQGQDILLTATVANSASNVPIAGNITFKVAGTETAVAVKDGMARLTTRIVEPGIHTLTASYGGDAANQSSNHSTALTVTANPAAALWFQTGGSIAFADSKDPDASLQYGLTAVKLNTIEAGGFIAQGGNGLAYGKVPDPLNQGDGPWVQYRVARQDPATHGGNNRRTEESMKQTLYMGDEAWVVFEWFTPVDKGLGQMRARTSSDADNAAIFQVHHDDAQNALMPGIAAPLISLNVGTNTYVNQASALDNRKGYLTFVLSEIETKTDAQGNPKFSQRATSIWSGGTPGKFVSLRDGFAAPGWPDAFVGSKTAFAVHFKLGYQPGTFYTRAWMAKRGGAVTKVMDNTTIGNMPDLSRTTSTPGAVPVAYIKNGLYAYNIPADASTGFEWISMKKRLEVYRNQNGILSAPGKTEDQVAETLIRGIQN